MPCMLTSMSHAAPRRTARPIFSFAIAAASTFLIVGCKSTNTESYSVELFNAGSEPVTVWVTKTGDRSQADWLAPEDLSTSRAAAVDKINGEVIPPGKTGAFGPISGEFAWEDRAQLRVYSGQLTFDQLLATPADGSLRVDVTLDEGLNRLVVRGPKLSVERSTGATTKP